MFETVVIVAFCLVASYAGVKAQLLKEQTLEK